VTTKLSSFLENQLRVLELTSDELVFGLKGFAAAISQYIRGLRYAEVKEKLNKVMRSTLLAAISVLNRPIKSRIMQSGNNCNKNYWL
jgi:hypothetical protein